MPDETKHSEATGWPGSSVTDDQIRAALRRIDVPDGFTERLMQRVETLPDATPRHRRSRQASRRGVLLRWTQPVWRIGYAAAALLAITAGAVHVEHRRVEQQKTNMAAAQFDTALAVTNHALNQVSAKLEKTELGAVQHALESSRGDQR